MSQSQNVILGIDLGTTYSAAAHVDREGAARLIPNAQGERITPSVVLLGEKAGEVIVGQPAKDEAVLHPERVIALVKREMGKRPEEVREGRPYRFWKRLLSPEEISSFILKQLKRDAEQHLKAEVREAVITVPAYFSDFERGATLKAGEMAGLQVRRIINEPTAAALYYGMHKAERDQTAFVFDLGGGTFDVTVLKIFGKEIRVVGTNGDHRLGGADWDQRLVEHVAEQFQMEYGRNPLENDEAAALLLERAEKAKRRLSDLAAVQIMCECGGDKFKAELTRERFEDLTSALLMRCQDLCRFVLEECKLDWRQIDTIILAGGSTRMPMVKNMLRQISGKEIRSEAINPDECVALGAALQAALLQNENDSSLSARPRREYRIAALVDVTAHSLGMITLQNRRLKNSIIIPKNHAIPCELSREDFVASFDNQEVLDIHLVQGESENPYHATLLASYEFYDLPRRPRGQTRIRVAFKYNANGVVEVSAQDAATQKTLPFRKKEKPRLEDLEAGSSKPLDVMLALDCSGSMSGRPLEDAKNAAAQFLDKIDLESNRVGIVSFGTYARLIQRMSNDSSALYGGITSLQLEGSTNMAAGIATAQQELRNEPGRANIMIVLTDGHPDDAARALEAGARAKAAGTRLITIGVGSGVDKSFLQRLASAPEDYHFVNESFELETTFVNIATELSSGGLQRRA